MSKDPDELDLSGEEALEAPPARPCATPHELVEKAFNALSDGETLAPLGWLEQALHGEGATQLLEASAPNFARALSYYAWLIATERGQIRRGLEMLQDAMEHGPDEVDVYRNLARVYLKAGKKTEALHVLDAGLKRDPDNAGLHEELVHLGVRKQPVLPFLTRRNVLNRWLGKLRHRFANKKS